MRGFITIALLLALACAVEISNTNPYSFFMEVKASQAKLAADGSKVRNQLGFHGAGITDGQESLLKQWADQAEQVHGGDLYNNALFLQQKAEDNWAGRWSVEIFGGDPSWGRATHVEGDQWIILFGYTRHDWDYIISKPQC